MFYGIVSAILTSFGDIIYKKALLLSEGKVSDTIFQFIEGSILLVLLIFVLWFLSVFDIVSVQVNVTYLIVGLFIITALIGIVQDFFYQYSYKNEKIGILSPYGEFEAILTIILGFFLFSESSLITFASAAIWGGVLIIWSIDFQKMSFNKYCLSMIAAWWLWAMKYNIYGYVLLTLTPISALFFQNLFTFLLLLLLVFYFRELGSLKHINAQIWGYVTIESFVWLIVWFISLYLVDEFWIVLATLLGMLTLAANIVFAYFFLGETPKRKGLIITLLIIVCVFIWSYFA